MLGYVTENVRNIFVISSFNFRFTEEEGEKHQTKKKLLSGTSIKIEIIILHTQHSNEFRILIQRSQCTSVALIFNLIEHNVTFEDYRIGKT